MGMGLRPLDQRNLPERVAELLLDRIATDRHAVLSYHFPWPGLGNVVRQRAPAALTSGIAMLGKKTVLEGQQAQVSRYAAELAKQDGALAQLRDRQSELRKRQAALQTELNTLIEKLEF